VQHAVAVSEPWLILRVGTRRCALPVSSVIETMRPLPVDAVGQSVDGVRGLSRIRGAFVPVVDAAALFGESHEAGPASRFVTLRVGTRVVALAVDAVIGVREVATAEWRALPPLASAATSAAVQAMTRADAELVLALDAARVIPEDVA